MMICSNMEKIASKFIFIVHGQFRKCLVCMYTQKKILRNNVVDYTFKDVKMTL